VKCKNSLKGNVEPDQYIIQKGEQLSEPAPREIVKEITVTPEILTYQSALKLQVDNERLKLKIQNLEQQIIALETEIEEKQTLSEEEEPNAAQSWIENILQIGAPLLDKHFQLRQQALQIKAAEIAQRQQLSKIRKSNISDALENKRSIEDSILTYQDDPDTYQQLIDMYNNATSEEEFLKDLKQYDFEIYNSVKNGK
jgi:folylpolyglutamate synthase/dihydropteroate synthase